MPSKRDIIIPVKDFVEEHKHLISLLNKYDAPALRKEAADQSKELREMTGGMGQASGFIRRLMAENYLKHKGDYKNPTYPLAEGSTMNKPAKFDYRRVANTDQNGSNQSNYGASPFIQRHFGHATAVPFVRKRVAQPTVAETPAQKEAREEFPAVERGNPLQSYIDEFKHYEKNKIVFFASDKKKGGAAHWIGVLKDNNVASYAVGGNVAFRTGFDENGIDINKCYMKIKGVNQIIRSVKLLNTDRDGESLIIKQTRDYPAIVVEVEYTTSGGEMFSRKMHLKKLYEYAGELFIGELALDKEDIDINKKIINDNINNKDYNEDYNLTIGFEEYVLPK